MLGLAHTNMRADLHSVSPAAALKRAVFVSNPRIHKKQRKKEKSLMWFYQELHSSKAADALLNLQHTQFTPLISFCLVGHSNVTTFGTQTRIDKVMCLAA